MPEVGRVLGGRYRLVELVGQGGMATIYRAQDGQLSRDVAIKNLRGEYGADAAFVVRFRREAQAAAQLNHPNVVAVFDYGTDLVGPYIVMELVTGGDLAAVLRERGRLPPTAAARIGQQIGDALDAAHARGIVHRDIKPSNVLLSSGGRVKVADFGIAQAFSEAQLTLTAPGMTMGSVHYFSPEQARGEVVTTASDIYSAGLVLYEMITGQRAFMGDSAAAVAMARLTGQVPSPAAVRRDVPMPLDAIVRWALQPDARNRPSAAELSSALGRYLADPHGTSGYAAAAPPPPPPTSSLYAPAASDPEPSSGRWGMLAALIGLFVLVLAGVLVFLVIASGTGGGPHATATPRPGATTPPDATPGATQFPAPQLAGLILEAARAAAAEAHLRLVIDPVVSDQPIDTVLSQDPAAGALVLPGSTVLITVAKLSDTVTVPDLRNETADGAVQALTAAGLTPGTQFQIYNATVPVGLVVKSDPRAAFDVARGTSVDYWLSRGPKPTASPLGSALPSPTPTPTPRPSRTPKPTRKPTPVPTATPAATPVKVANYECEDLATARGQIEAIGLTVGTVTPGSPPRDDSWLVIIQLPMADAEVQPGESVDLTVEDPTLPCPPGP